MAVFTFQFQPLVCLFLLILCFGPTTIRCGITLWTVEQVNQCAPDLEAIHLSKKQETCKLLQDWDYCIAALESSSNAENGARKKADEHRNQINTLMDEHRCKEPLTADNLVDCSHGMDRKCTDGFGKLDFLNKTETCPSLNRMEVCLMDLTKHCKQSDAASMNKVTQSLRQVEDAMIICTEPLTADNVVDCSHGMDRKCTDGFGKLDFLNKTETCPSLNRMEFCLMDVTKHCKHSDAASMNKVKQSLRQVKDAMAICTATEDPCLPKARDCLVLYERVTRTDDHDLCPAMKKSFKCLSKSSSECNESQSKQTITVAQNGLVKRRKGLGCPDAGSTIQPTIAIVLLAATLVLASF